MPGRRVRVIGAGRAGGALQLALGRRGWEVAPALGRGDDLTAAAAAVDLLVIATPDGAIPEVAAAVAPSEAVVVVHLSGALGADVLTPHPRRAPIHPLVALPSAELGAARLLAGATFALAAEGDALGAEVVADLGGHPIVVADGDRARYHAAACIASNHLVALLGQAARVAALAGVPLDAYLGLVRGTVDNVAALGPAGALTGPAARGDWATIERHLEALDPAERPAYEALMRAARRLVAPDEA